MAILASAAVLVSACKREASKGTPREMASAPPPAPPPPPNETLAQSIHGCPTTLVGASTSVEDAPDGVIVWIIGNDDAAIDEIRARAKHLAEAARDEAGLHTGKGTGRARGPCPLVLRGTSIEETDVDVGARVVVTAVKPSEVAWVKREVRARIDELNGPDPGGPGRMSLCPSAVPDAATEVRDTKDGVILTVTSPSQPGEHEIRTRAALALAELRIRVTKPPPPGFAPRLGLCPIVVDDTAASSKEVAGGVQITLRARRPQRVAQVQHDAHARAAGIGTRGR